MDFYNSLKKFLGLSSSNNNNSDDNRSNSYNNVRDEFTRDTPHEQRPDDYERFGFNVFTNPLEMHRYFESQMNAIMRSFGMFNGNGSFFGNNEDSFFGDSKEPFFGNMFSFDSPQLPKSEDFDENSDSLRNHYLKPGYEEAQPHEQVQVDKDLDGKFDIGDLDSILKGKPSQPRMFSYGQSMSTKVIRKADGTVETHKTFQDQQGNKQITVTHNLGNKEYSVTTKIDKDGHQEVIENFVNMDETEKDALLKGSNKQLFDKSDKVPPNWFPFDKFF